ncbi:MAG: SAM-dependent chlorinase/fluorinase [Deltaproteobacteria bacterium]|nr:SAM-dependent chlorinase/fluorinase [Deltaproteobacteria bacterium]
MALTTDFGLDDPYVGILKAVLLSFAPAARLLDLTHGVPPQDVLAGCLALEAARPFVPAGTVHLAVVDPGVGSERRALVVDAGRDLWVAPDNGLLSFLPEGEIRQVRALEDPALFLRPVSRTFHGRDVFAPVAARLASGTPLESLGPVVDTFCRIPVPAAVITAEGVRGEVLTFDRFGNALTSLREGDLPAGAWNGRVRGRWIVGVLTYAAVLPGEPLCLVGSSGRVEISVRNASARDVLGLGRGEEVLVRPC